MAAKLKSASVVKIRIHRPESRSNVKDYVEPRDMRLRNNAGSNAFTATVAPVRVVVCLANASGLIRAALFLRAKVQATAVCRRVL